MNYQAINEKPWTFEFWESSTGTVPVVSEFLDDLERRDNMLFTSLYERMGRYTQYPLGQQFKAHHIESIGADLFEFRFHLQDEVRFIGHVSYEGSVNVFYVFCAFKKKTNRITKKYLRLAEMRHEEFKLIQSGG